MQKFVCTTIRPTAFIFPELISSIEEIAKFVADFIQYEPLEDQINLVRTFVFAFHKASVNYSAFKFINKAKIMEYFIRKVASETILFLEMFVFCKVFVSPQKEANFHEGNILIFSFVSNLIEVFNWLN